MKREFLGALAVATLAIQTAQAEVKLESIWGDGMVLQRNSEILFEGKSDGTSVTITTTWSGKTKYKATVENGCWSVEIPTPDVDHIPHSITFDDGDKLTLSNTLLGDVWLCLGQSNMLMPMKGYFNQPVEGVAEVIASAKPSRAIRMYTAKITTTSTPQDEVDGEWRLNTPSAVSEFSAAAYFFANMVESIVNVPIGLVSVNKGATTIETWMSRESLDETGIAQNYTQLENKKFTVRTPCAHYNGMMAPLKSLAVKGALWYQGESNRDKPEAYLTLFPKFLEQLRSEFRGGVFPFYYVQIAPFVIQNNKKNEFVLMREVMTKLMDLTPRTGMVTTTDIGEEFSIHPRQKREVGERLALWALGDTYGVKSIEYRTPEFKAATPKVDPQTKQAGLDISFNYAALGLSFADGANTSDLFEVAGDDGIFYPAKVKLINRGGACLFVWSDEVAAPKDMRYAFRNYVKGDLFSSFGLPISSFRTDNYDL